MNKIIAVALITTGILQAATPANQKTLSKEEKLKQLRLLMEIAKKGEASQK